MIYSLELFWSATINKTKGCVNVKEEKVFLIKRDSGFGLVLFITIVNLLKLKLHTVGSVVLWVLYRNKKGRSFVLNHIENNRRIHLVIQEENSKGINVDQ